MTEDIGWEFYRSFLAVLREGSLSGAARALGITQPTAGRHIDRLEEALGLVLFIRSQTGFLPTEAARALQPHAEAMEGAALALARTAASQGEGVSGVVRVTASEVIGIEVLPAIVAALREQYPRLKIELVMTNRVQDLLHREADIAVRMAPPQQEQLIARRIGQLELGLHAHPDYLARHGTPLTAEDLLQHAQIGFDQLTPFIRMATRKLPGIARENFALMTDSDVGQLALIRAGAGIGFCQVPLARRQPALVRVLPDQYTVMLDTWIVMHENLRASRSCQAVFAALADGLQAHLGND